MSKIIIEIPNENREVFLHVQLRDGSSVTKSYFDAFSVVPGTEINLKVSENV